MAPNSSLFNEAPTEAKPSATATETPLSSTADARPTVTAATASVTTAADCSSKQVAPKMEPTIEENEALASDPSDVGASLRFARVAPVGLDEAKATMVFRKSCLKRSSSFLPSSLSAIHDALKVEKVEIGPSAEEKKEPEAPVQKNRRRCWECKAKVGLTAVTCRCDYTFCNKHRYAEEHNCRFNFKASAKRKLEDENPRVVPAKVARIN